MTPFRSEKNTNWEGAFRVPLSSAGRARSRPGVVSNEIVQHHDWLPTFLAAAGEPDIVEKLKEGHEAGDKTFKVHIDGYNLLPYLTGEEERARARGSSTSRTTATSSRSASTTGSSCSWSSGRAARSSSGRSRSSAARAEALQPADRSVRAGGHDLEHLLGLVHRPRPTSSWPRRRSSTEFLETFKEFPPRQKAASFTIDQAIEKMEAAASGAATMDAERSPPGTTRATREAIVDVRRVGGADGARRRSGSPSSTTTARSGARSRCRSSSASSSSGWPRWPRQDPSLRERQPWKAAYEKDYAWLGAVIDKHYAGDDSDVKVLLGRHPRRPSRPDGRRLRRGGRGFLDEAQHPTLERRSGTAATCRWSSSCATSRRTASPATSPRAASRDFMRPSPGRSTGSRPSGSIGSSNGLTTQDDEHGGSVVYLAQPDVFDDGPVKPVRIWSRIGRRPIVAGGNSNGDSRCSASPGARTARRCACCPPRRRRARVRLRRGRREGARAGQRRGLDGRQREGRLGDRLRGRIAGRRLAVVSRARPARPPGASGRPGGSSPRPSRGASQSGDRTPGR